MDQCSLRYLLEQHTPLKNNRNGYPSYLGYDYEITYKTKKENATADALTHQVTESSLDALFVQNNQPWDDIKQEVEKHPHMKKINALAQEKLGRPYTCKSIMILHWCAHSPRVPSAHNVTPPSMCPSE